MIQVISLTKKFGNFIAVNNISFNIEKGDFVGIVGDSGSGKSTLLYLMSGLLSPTSGNVLFNNVDITSKGDSALSKIRVDSFGFVFQSHNLIPGLTVLENIEIPLVLADKKPKMYYEKIYNLLREVGLEEHINKDVSNLSGGQQQRISIIRALINEPSIIFADEPTGNLDSQNTDNIIDLFNLFNKEKNVTIAMVTHSEKTLKYCNKIIEISDGKLVV